MGVKCFARRGFSQGGRMTPAKLMPQTLLDLVEYLETPADYQLAVVHCAMFYAASLLRHVVGMPNIQDWRLLEYHNSNFENAQKQVRVYQNISRPGAVLQ